LDWRRHEFDSAAAPGLAVDAAGDLHFSGGSYSVDPDHGILDRLGGTMERPTVNGMMVHGRQMPAQAGTAAAQPAARAILRAAQPGVNPVDPATDAGALAATAHYGAHAAAIGGVSAGAVVLSDLALDATPWREGVRAGVQGAGLGLAGLALVRQVPDVGIGLMVGGVVGAVRRAARTYAVDRVVASWVARLRGQGAEPTPASPPPRISPDTPSAGPPASPPAPGGAGAGERTPTAGAVCDRRSAGEFPAGSRMYVAPPRI
jgi:hypothetical protein